MAQLVDMGGDTLVVQDIQVGASGPGQTGVSLGGSTVTAGTVAASDMVVVDANRNIVNFNNIGFTGVLQESVAIAVTAGTTRTQAGATALTKEINRVDTSTAPAAGTTLGDGVLLPATANNIGKDILVINNTNNPIQVYGTGADTINGVTNTVGVFQQPNSVGMYVSAASGAWYSIDIAMGYSGNYQTTSAVNGLTAHAGGGQGSATALPAMINRVTVVGTAADSVILPTSTPGLQIFVANAAAANSMNVFPQSGDTINALSANTAIAVAAGHSGSFYCANAGAWHSLIV